MDAYDVAELRSFLQELEPMLLELRTLSEQQSDYYGDGELVAYRRDLVEASRLDVQSRKANGLRKQAAAFLRMLPKDRPEGDAAYEQCVRYSRPEAAMR